jgi:hypothetical protein
MEQPSDDIAAIMQKMLADNAAAAEAVVAGARTERNVAAAERADARQALLDAQKNADKLSAGFYKEYYSRLEKDLGESLTRNFAARLLRIGKSPGEVAALLDAPDPLIAEVARSVGFVPVKLAGTIEATTARATYEDQGRGGYLQLYWGQHTCRFWFEAAAHPALLLVEIPREEQWEAQTSIPLAQRPHVLQFMAERMVADQMPGHRYRIEVNSIVIF